VILFLADLVWHVAKTFIDRTIATSNARTGLAADAAARHARLRTLLPILRNMLFIIIAVIAVLMALSSLGVPIAPLIAGAGVVGVAVGFGAQTIVKDIISGVFYLLDDAFRVGEYIESGAYSGNVESFSLRSVRLRHPRGGVFTVPFGELGAIENLHRDWAIDKFVVNVGYGTDFAKAKKLVKEVGAALLVDPDVGASFIEPLKLQGIQELGPYSIALRMKMTVRPGEQSTIRRKVLAMIKASFDKNGIEFPLPTVHVATGGQEAAQVAAHEALLLAAVR
jgi:small-conductance mechanosensitive channel